MTVRFFPHFHWPDLLRPTILALAYVLLARIAISFGTANITVLWLPGGLALATVLSGGRKYWPGIFSGAFAAGLLSDDPAWVSTLIALGNTLETMVTAWMLGRVRSFDPELNGPRDYLILASAGAAGAGISAMIGPSALSLAGLLPPATLLPMIGRWWLGDVLGIALAAPFCLVWRRPPRSWLRKDRLPEAVACFGLTLLAGSIILMGQFAREYAPYHKVFLLFIAISWAAVRFGRHGALLVLMIVTIQGLTGVAGGIGYFGEDYARSGLINFWIFLMTFGGNGMMLALVINARNRTEKALTERERHLATLVSLSPVGVFETDAAGRCTFLNRRACEIIGLPPPSAREGTPEEQSLPGNHWAASAHPADHVAILAKWTEAVGNGRPFQEEYRYLRPDGEIRWVIGQAEAFLSADNETPGYVGTIIDITERKEAEEALRLASLVYEASSEAMAVTDADGTIMAVNPAFTQMTGYTAAEVVGKSSCILNSGRHGNAFFREMWRSIRATGSWQGEIWNRRKNGEIYPEWLTINTVFNDDGSVHRRVALFADITEHKKFEETIWQQANFDALTGLPNRRMFQDRLAQEIRKSHRAGLSLAVMFLDLDRFKEINDTLGHNVGDILLRTAAQRLRNCVRNADTVARLGGDEFTVILGELDDTSGVERVSHEILRAMSAPFQLETETAYVSCSIGITLYPDDGIEIEELLKNADQAMYESKRLGRNRFNFFKPAMQEAALNRARLTNELRTAIAERQFVLFYQPIVEMATGAIRKAEALIRWHHPTRGIVSPAEFIPLAEETGMIVDIGEWVFHEAANQAARWHGSFLGRIQISINNSPMQFRDESSHHSEWARHLEELGLTGESIAIEITEGVLMDASDATDAKLLDLRDAGIQVSLDDFGTGYSSLAYLKQFHIDYLKIDQSFVRNLSQDSHELALCEAIIVMAHKLGMKVIAEGVETESQRDLLSIAGCDYGQGYLFSEPLSVDAFEARLRQGMAG